MKMPTDLPPSVQQQKTLLAFTTRCGIFRHNLVGLLTPNQTLATGLTEDVPLIVAIKINPDTRKATNKDEEGDEGRQIGRTLGEVKGMGGVHAGNPHKTSPAEIVSRPIDLNVHGTHVPHLPMKEFGDVHQLQCHVDRHAELQRAIVHFHVLVREAEYAHRPEHHAGTAVGEHLHIPSEDAGVEFHSPVEIDDPISSIGSAVRGGGRDMTLDQENEAERKGEYVHGGQDFAEFVVDRCGTDEVAVSQEYEREECCDVGYHAIGPVDRTIALWRDGGREGFSGCIFLKK